MVESARRTRATREVSIEVLLYAAYTVVRNLLGDHRDTAERNARRITDLERTLGLLHERTIQRASGRDAPAGQKL